MYEAGVGSPVVVGGQLACFSKLVGRILGIVIHFAFLDIVMDVFLYICAIAGWLCSVVVLSFSLCAIMIGRFFLIKL